MKALALALALGLDLVGCGDNILNAVDSGADAGIASDAGVLAAFEAFASRSHPDGFLHHGFDGQYQL